MARYFIKTFGCKVNQAESSELADILKAAGLQQTSILSDADAVIVNTCTVTGEADRKVRKALRRAVRTDRVQTVIATGCSAVLLKAQLEALDAKITVIADKSDIPAALAAVVDALPAAEHDQNSPVSLPDTPSTTAPSAGKRIRVPLKVQDGCEDFCSYCIVPYARPTLQSVSAKAVIAHINQLVQKGSKEVVLTGINLGNYSDSGTDGGAADIAALLRRIVAETDLHRVRLSSIEPAHINDDLLELLAAGDFLCQHLHIPLQSGSDAVLGDMNRRYTAADYQQLVARIRDVAADTALTTDVIVGYPSESDQDWQQTLDLVRTVGFARVHVFRYSSRQHTAAAQLTPLNPRVLARRARELQDQADLDALRYQKQRIGSMVEAIIETIDCSTQRAIGTTREYLRIALPATDLSLGDVVQLRLSQANFDTIEAADESFDHDDDHDDDVGDYSEGEQQ
ncbi:MAG: tRNA (N(6)-L-threonylcarbamoyladenosine(37)-C(2))-methylthiotransferase MtaB [Coriobacteriia bacterium]|nr:tRNA (N(6)-L-threonylcarbamoyladenosine(37)-C(2))-methylthiotransferase MtaB [Coriobacteriia bacterium]